VPVRDAIAGCAALLVACATTAPGDPPVPLVTAPAPSCPPTTLPFGEDCVETAPIRVEDERGRGGWFAPRRVDGRTFWYSPGPQDQRRAEDLCADLGGRPLTPLTRRDIGVGQHFAVLSAEVGTGEPSIWTGWRLDLQTGHLVDLDGEQLLRWQPGRPPMRGRLDDPVEAELQEDIDRVAQGLESLRGIWRTMLNADGAISVGADSTDCCGIVCEAL